MNQYCQGEEVCQEQPDRMEPIFHALEGCDGVIAMRIGVEPQKKLQMKGIVPINTYDMVENAVKKAAMEL